MSIKLADNRPRQIKYRKLYLAMTASAEQLLNSLRCLGWSSRSLIEHMLWEPMSRGVKFGFQKPGFCTVYLTNYRSIADFRCP